MKDFFCNICILRIKNKMRIELWILFCGLFYLYHVHTNGLWIYKYILPYKIYFCIFILIFISWIIIPFMKKHHEIWIPMILYSNDLFNASILSSKQYKYNINKNNKAFVSNIYIPNNNTILPLTQTTKRVVSETKKKWVASNQSWKCGNCNEILDHTYEIDHRIRLEYGGSNDVSNLIALCRNCHGRKTAMEKIIQDNNT